MRDQGGERGRLEIRGSDGKTARFRKTSIFYYRQKIELLV
jgi:hypothetical protein